jgi:hypothetical protein
MSGSMNKAKHSVDLGLSSMWCLQCTVLRTPHIHTCSRKDNDLLMYPASLSTAPSLLVLLTLSLPARSTRFSLLAWDTK